MHQVVTFTGIETKTGQNDSGGWTLYLFSSAGGAKYQTFDDDLGKAGVSLIGQSAEVEYEVQERTYKDRTGQERTGQNNVLKSVKAATGNPPTAQGAELVSVTPSFTVDPRTITEPERQLRIMRQSALDRAIATVAAGIVEVSDPRDLFDLSDTYIDYFEQGAAAFRVEETAKF